jgi:hypothetical protein
MSMEPMKKREIIEKYASEIYKAGKDESLKEELHEEFTAVCEANGFIGELREQLWQSITKRVDIMNR